MSDENDSWLESALGIDIQGILGTNLDAGTAVLEPTAPPADAAVDVDTSSSASNANASVADIPSTSDAPPVIQLRIANQVFQISGSRFLKKHSVSVRIFDAVGGQTNEIRIPTHSDDSGKIDCPVAFCLQGTGIAYFSATDGRSVPESVDRTGFLWSNTVQGYCVAGNPSDDDKKDDPDPPNNEPDPARDEPAPSE